MTDKDIIKALECCHKGRAECEECPLWHTSGANADCVDRLTGSALNLINRQKEELKRLKDIAESPILGKLIYAWKNEAIKAFAEKLKANMHQIQVGNYKFNIITDYSIDNYVKEMVGEDDTSHPDERKENSNEHNKPN